MLAAALLATTTVVAHSAAPVITGTHERLFAADSLWNSRPVDPVLGTYVIPKSDYFPMVSEGGWSTGVFLAKPDDPAVVVHGAPGK
jgi:hypothetical protein